MSGERSETVDDSIVTAPVGIVDPVLDLRSCRIDIRVNQASAATNPASQGTRNAPFVHQRPLTRPRNTPGRTTSPEYSLDRGVRTINELEGIAGQKAFTHAVDAPQGWIRYRPIDAATV